MPGGAVGFHVGPEFAEEAGLELEDGEDAIGGDERAGDGGSGIGEQDVFEFVGAGREDGGALVDLGGIEQVEDGEMLDGENFVHAFEAEAALAIEEVGDVGLLESGLLGEAESGEFAGFDTSQKDFTEVFLQNFELHWREYSRGARVTLKDGE